MISTAQIESYRKDGFLIIPGFINPHDADLLNSIARGDQSMTRNAFGLVDTSGKSTKLTLWYTPGDDVYGRMTRSKSAVEAANFLMDGAAETGHFQTKLMQKEPRVGGAWEWHQDYGYWYKNEFLFPDQMISMMIAITDATKENGCVQIIPGTHKMGRMEHGFSGEQVGASMRFVELALQTMPLKYVELKAGDVLFFHPNLLHRSAPNLSDSSRWSIISVYNRASNPGYNEPQINGYAAIIPIDDDEVFTDARGLDEGRDFLRKEADNALK